MLKKRNPQFSAMPTNDKVALIVAMLEEKKARGVVAFDIHGLSPFTDATIVAGAGSVRHAQSLADQVRLLCKEHNFENLRTEGYQAGQWILVDLNDILVNIFLPETREQYRLESLWTGCDAKILHDARSESETAATSTNFDDDEF
ncbi:MAG: ribosome silencing factor [Pseudomonadota bacterium]